MAIIIRHQILRHKEVILPQSAGTIPDGGFSTYNLDDPTITPTGTGDFLGLIRDITLLGEVMKEIVDTKKYTINQFNGLSQQQYDDAIKNGTITRREEIIGWVQIAKSRPSFYYKDCERDTFIGKNPIVEHYYDTQDFNFGNYVVIGSSPTDEGSDLSFSPIALTTLKNFDANIYTNMGVIGPRFDPMTLAEYISISVFQKGIVTNNDGETRQINTIPPATTETPLVVPLFIANNGEHFANKNANPDQNGKYGYIRATISRGITTFFHVINTKKPDETVLDNTSIGECLYLSGKTSTSPGTGGKSATDLGDPDDIYVSDPELELPTPITESFILGDPCSTVVESKNPELIDDSRPHFISGSTSQPFEPTNINDVYANTRTSIQINDLARGIRDPRDLIYDTLVIPKGLVKIAYDCLGCDTKVLPNFRDKDGDIPEPVGPVVANYIENVRRTIIDTFSIQNGQDSILKDIGCGTDGIVQYSDGNSYIELLGESILGCGDIISPLSVPEFFVEMYKVFESETTRKYRREIERPSSLPDWLGDLVNDRVHDQAHITDLVQDITIGIPDQDYMEGKTITFDNWIKWEDWTNSYPDDDWEERNDRKLPSRWKSMVRPIFEKTMTSAYRLPSWDSIETLGNTDTFRNNRIAPPNGNVVLSKTIYDRIDEAISVKLDEKTLKNQRDNSLEDGFDVWGFVLQEIMRTYTTTFEIPGTDINLIIPNVQSIQTTIDIVKKVANDPQGYVKSVNWNDVAKDVVIQAIKIGIDFIVGKIISDLSAVNPNRYALKPLRLFKNGSVILQSRSGIYSTMYEPCPIIFLGFNDPGQINFDIRKLTKKDETELLYYTDKKSSIKISSDKRETSTPVITPPTPPTPPARLPDVVLNIGDAIPLANINSLDCDRINMFLQSNNSIISKSGKNQQLQGCDGLLPGQEMYVVVESDVWYGLSRTFYFRKDKNGKCECLLVPKGTNLKQSTVSTVETQPLTVSKVTNANPLSVIQPVNTSISIDSRDSVLPSGVLSRPMMKRRIKKYGMNPLLDIFYLNMKPAKNSKHPYTNRVPFGWDTDAIKRSEEEQGSYIPENIWPEFSWGQYPSIFPPMWNEFVRNTNLPTLTDFDLKPGSVWGDRAWKRRTPNTILSIEDRWETYLLRTGKSEEIDSSENSNSEMVVFRDKTPILDLYFMLMEMHVRGVSWSEILNYVEQIKKCVVSGRRGHRILLDELDKVSYTVSTALGMFSLINDKDSLFIPPVIDWGIVEDLSLFDGTQKPVYRQYLSILNRTNKPLILSSIKIEQNYNGEFDLYGMSGRELFFLNQIPNGLIYSNDEKFFESNKELGSTINVPPLPVNSDGTHSYKFDDIVKIPIYFHPFNVQNNFTYSAILTLAGIFDGQEFEYSTLLVAKPMSDYDKDMEKTFEKEPLYASPELYFKNLAKDENYVVGVNYYQSDIPINESSGKQAKTYLVENLYLSNLSEVDDIVVEEMKFVSQTAYGTAIGEYNSLTKAYGDPFIPPAPFNQSPFYNQSPYFTETPFFKFVNSKTEFDREKPLNIVKKVDIIEDRSIKLNKTLKRYDIDNSLDSILNQYIAFTPIYENKIYVGMIEITYSITETTDGVKKMNSGKKYKTIVKIIGNHIQ